VQDGPDVLVIFKQAQLWWRAIRLRLRRNGKREDTTADHSQQTNRRHSFHDSGPRRRIAASIAEFCAFGNRGRVDVSGERKWSSSEARRKVRGN
jgi:hypothetical protein